MKESEINIISPEELPEGWELKFSSETESDYAAKKDDIKYTLCITKIFNAYTIDLYEEGDRISTAILQKLTMKEANVVAIRLMCDVNNGRF